MKNLIKKLSAVVITFNIFAVSAAYAQESTSTFNQFKTAQLRGDSGDWCSGGQKLPDNPKEINLLAQFEQEETATYIVEVKSIVYGNRDIKIYSMTFNKVNNNWCHSEWSLLSQYRFEFR